MTLTCTHCGKTTELPDNSTVRGVPLAEWFTSRGQLCTECFTAPALQLPTTGGSIQETFEQFHRLNPWVYDHLLMLTSELLQHGARKCGIGMLFEVLRWQYMRTTRDPASDFKLNNNYRSRYVRLLIDQNPHLDGVFELRRLKAA